MRDQFQRQNSNISICEDCMFHWAEYLFLPNINSLSPHISSNSISHNAKSTKAQSRRSHALRFPEAINFHETRNIIHIRDGSRRRDARDASNRRLFVRSFVSSKRRRPRWQIKRPEAERRAARLFPRDLTINRPGDLLLQSGWFPSRRETGIEVYWIERKNRCRCSEQKEAE